MARLPLAFLVSATVYLLIGMVFGIWMAATHDHVLSPAHGHLNLIGWVSMALFGLFYHCVPAAMGRTGWLHFWVTSVGLWILVPGIALTISGVTELPAIVGSFLSLAGIVLFLFILIGVRRTQQSAPAIG